MENQPPLTVSADDIAFFLEAVGKCCHEIEFAMDLIDGIIAKSGLGQHAANELNGVFDDLSQRKARVIP